MAIEIPWNNYPVITKQPDKWITDCNRPISQIPQCLGQTSHDAPFCNRNVHTCTHFCYIMANWGIRAVALRDLCNGLIAMHWYKPSFDINQKYTVRAKLLILVGFKMVNGCLPVHELPVMIYETLITVSTLLIFDIRKFWHKWYVFTSGDIFVTEI